jgi:hypothetical protein
MGQRYGREPIVLHQCGDCGAYVADQGRHDEWHHHHPPVSDETLSAILRAHDRAAPQWGIPSEAAAFGRLLFHVAQDHLDPAHNRLQWSEGFTGGGKEFGRKFGWAAPDDPGQAMVYVGVGDQPEEFRLPCGHYDYPGPSNCRTVTMPDQSPAQVLTNPDRREVHWSRPDGSYVFAIVDSTFRNNSLVPSHAPLPTLEQLQAFVMDPRLVFPS